MPSRSPSARSSAATPAQVEAGIERVRATLPRLGELAIGGTAVGTGLNAPEGFGAKVVEVLVAQTGLAELTTAKNSFEAQAARDGLVEGLRCAEDHRRLADQDRQRHPLDGLRSADRPRRTAPARSAAGFLDHAGQVNPVLPEAVTQVAAQVIGNDAAITVGGLSGAFELNVYIPMMARSLLESFTLLANVSGCSPSAASTAWSPMRTDCADWRVTSPRSSHR